MLKQCARCVKTVYPTEELKCMDKVWHKMCFKCNTCGMTLNMKNYKGYDKLPYCNAHYPKSKHTVVADTPENRRIAENTKIQSQLEYHREFEASKDKYTQIADTPEMRTVLQNTQKISMIAYHKEYEQQKGKKTSVADDPETQRVRQNMEIISNVSYHGDKDKRQWMEQNRPAEQVEGFDDAEAGRARRDPRPIADYDPMADQGTPYSNRNSAGARQVYDSNVGRDTAVGPPGSYYDINQPGMYVEPVQPAPSSQPAKLSRPPGVKKVVPPVPKRAQGEAPSQPGMAQVASPPGVKKVMAPSPKGQPSVKLVGSRPTPLAAVAPPESKGDPQKVDSQPGPAAKFGTPGNIKKIGTVKPAGQTGMGTPAVTTVTMAPTAGKDANQPVRKIKTIPSASASVSQSGQPAVASTQSSSPSPSVPAPTTGSVTVISQPPAKRVRSRAAANAALRQQAGSPGGVSAEANQPAVTVKVCQPQKSAVATSPQQSTAKVVVCQPVKSPAGSSGKSRIITVPASSVTAQSNPQVGKGHGPGHTQMPVQQPMQQPMQQPYQPPPQQSQPPPPQVNPMVPKGRVCKAMYDYEAADTDEVGFKEEDIIDNCVDIDQGWMEGTVRRTGLRGMLPSNYVEDF